MEVGERHTMPPRSRWYIYGIYDSTDNVIRYVGKALNPAARLNNHFLEALAGRDTPLNRWLLELADMKRTPSLVILAHTKKHFSTKAERKWIAKIQNENGQLLNYDLGFRKQFEPDFKNWNQMPGTSED